MMDTHSTQLYVLEYWTVINFLFLFLETYFSAFLMHLKLPLKISLFF